VRGGKIENRKRSRARLHAGAGASYFALPLTPASTCSASMATAQSGHSPSSLLRIVAVQNSEVSPFVMLPTAICVRSAESHRRL